jgi:hypothetical protein
MYSLCEVDLEIMERIVVKNIAYLDQLSVVLNTTEFKLCNISTLLIIKTPQTLLNLILKVQSKKKKLTLSVPMENTMKSSNPLTNLKLFPPKR